MKKSAIVRFIGDSKYYRLSCDRSDYKYCRDCVKNSHCKHTPKYQFINGNLYNAYFLEYWQGNRDSLHVKGEDGKIDDFNAFTDFEVVADEDGVLVEHEAVVRCITHDYDNAILELKYGKEYKAIGFDKEGLYLVMDESYDCYFYHKRCFEIIDDPHRVLVPAVSTHIYDWKNTHIDSVPLNSHNGGADVDG